jgi:hypothetical protein
MKQPGNKLLISILIFTIAFLSATLAQYYPGTRILIRIAFLFSIIYLFLGWHIFRYYLPDQIFPLRFFMGYLYASLLITSVFAATQWPMSSILITVSPLWVLIQLILVYLLRNKLSRECFYQLLIEGGLMMILSVLMIIRL